LPVEHCDKMTAHVDLFPTLAELAKAKIKPNTQKELEGISLVPYFKNPNDTTLGDRIAIHHKARWMPAASYPEHEYADVCVTYKDFTLMRVDNCTSDECVDCHSKTLNARREKPNAYGVTHFDTLPRGHWALYNIKYDRAQMRDLSEFYPDLVKKLSHQYDSWWKDTKKQLDKYSQDPEVQKYWKYADEYYGAARSEQNKKKHSQDTKAELIKFKDRISVK